MLAKIRPLLKELRLSGRASHILLTFEKELELLAQQPQKYKKLNPVYRDLVTMRCFDRKSYKEIAYVLYMKPAEVYKKLRGALRILKGRVNK